MVSVLGVRFRVGVRVGVGVGVKSGFQNRVEGVAGLLSGVGQGSQSGSELGQGSGFLLTNVGYEGHKGDLHIEDSKHNIFEDLLRQHRNYRQLRAPDAVRVSWNVVSDRPKLLRGVRHLRYLLVPAKGKINHSLGFSARVEASAVGYQALGLNYIFVRVKLRLLENIQISLSSI